MGEAVVYYVKERVKIVREVGLDYLVEDVDSGRQYLIDQSYFRRKYASEGELIPVHTELWERLNQLAADNYALRRAVTNKSKELKGERKKLEALRKKTQPKQHYRNGQKRGKTRNG